MSLLAKIGKLAYYISMNNITSLLSLKGETALITGGAMGIGKAIALLYAEAGANLQIVDINQEALEKTAHEIHKKFGVHIDTYLVDLSSSDNIATFWKNLPKAPDILVNNAGIFWSKDIQKTQPADYDRMMNINTKAPFLMCQQMIEKRGVKNAGTIINISSIEGKAAFNNDMTIYGMSKSSVMALTRGLTKDYAKYGWRTNSILPGGVMTPGAKNLGLTALKHFDFSILFTGIKFKSRLPLGRYAEPADIANAALYLAAPISSYVCGAELVVDGGFLAV